MARNTNEYDMLERKISYCFQLDKKATSYRVQHRAPKIWGKTAKKKSRSFENISKPSTIS